MTKSIDTLVQDIYNVLGSGEVFSDEMYQQLGNSIAQKIKVSIERSMEEPRIRMSNIGKKDRYLWFLVNKGKALPRSQEFTGDRLLNFLYGDIVEEMILWLAKAAGHSVTEEQKEVVVEGIVGHQDCRIDGVGIDVKSASNYGFRKFADRSILQNDPYGYLPQINGYFEGEEEKGFLAINKETGGICVTKLKDSELPNTRERIKHIKEMVKEPSPPIEKCYPEVDKGPNKAVSQMCASCLYRDICWADANDGKGLRRFKYSEGDVYFTQVNKEPRVEELDKDGKVIKKEIPLGFKKIL